MPLKHGRTQVAMNGPARQAWAYDRLAGVFGGPLYRKVAADMLAVGLPPGAEVLDVGTGPGRVPRRIVAADPQLRVHGVDLSEAMIARARRRATGVPQVAFRTGDVAALPFADASMDLVISTVSLHHWERPQVGLQEISRVLKPGAQAWIYDFAPVLHDPRLTAGPAAEVRLEPRVTRLAWHYRIDRLVLRKRSAR